MKRFCGAGLTAKEQETLMALLHKSARFPQSGTPPQRQWRVKPGVNIGTA